VTKHVVIVGGGLAGLAASIYLARAGRTVTVFEKRRYLGDVCELNFNDATQAQRMKAAWDLAWEDVLGPGDEFTIPEVIVMVARMRGWL
jgi:Phytoene dehydrogenase and related proteins